MIIDDSADKSSQKSQRRSTSTGSTYRYLNLESPAQSSEALTQATSGQAPLPVYSRRTQSGESSLEQGAPSFEERLAQDAPGSNGAPLRSTKLDAEAAFQDDGRLQISFGHRLSKRLPRNYAEPVHEIGIDEAGFQDAPPMNVNIMIVGSRGDVQPYLALGQKLQQYGHTVRLSTHETFRKLVKDAGLRFFNIGGDPHELMSYMVRNPGLIPGFESVRNGDIGKKQAMVAEMLDRCYLSCFAVDEGSPGERGFVADAIISNPPTFAHIHCAEAFGIPLLLSFTMPWCATAAFPHPLVNIKQSGSHEPKAVNYYSYTLVDMLTWQGLGHAINKFRTKKLGLEYLSTASAVSMVERCGIPWTYCLSPALVPKPQDWLAHIDVTGFYFLDLAKDYDPPADLVEFLGSGEPPIYIGFGSIVLKNPQEMTEVILEGIAQAGVRAIVSPGWGGLDETMIRAAGPHVFALGNAPHDWLFQYVRAVCHHGGAGTTAIGLKCGKPTIVIPFFGDQPWWAAQLAQRGAGPEPLDSRDLTSEGFAAAIRVALSPSTILAAQDIGAMINQEDGAKNGLESFHKHLPLLNMRCDLDQRRVAVWYSPMYKLRLSAFSAQVLADRGEIDMNKLKLHRPREYNTHALPTDPISGTALPIFRVINNFAHGMVKIGSSRPDKGVVKMVTATAGGLQTTLQGMTEGLTNVPKLYGSEILREPVKGYKEKGALGAVTGFGAGALNLYMKPFAGALQVVSMPVEGGVKNLRGMFHKDTSQERILVRHAEGVLAVKQSSQRDQDAVVQAFTEFKARASRERKGKGKMP
ncbi:unnamed protein product [Rhizoctonia solani]|uniref:Sterol 3-beta-glucosyltransferase UGT80B1 n=1 Tax=Rhizoctonia solani TaxID=456999 RepID=A0A8H3DHH5_9AGAM|nr:unnamed protein product [Rhizoctonia solani]